MNQLNQLNQLNDRRIRSGDIGLTVNKSLIARGIIWAQRLIDKSKDPIPYSHAFIVSTDPSIVYEASSKINFSPLRKYLNKKVLIARPVPALSFTEAHRGRQAVYKLEGKNYPTYRLALFLLGWADNLVFSDSLVCSELVAKFLICSGRPEFEDFRGIMPDDIEDLIRSKYQVVYEDIMTESDYLKLIGVNY